MVLSHRRGVFWAALAVAVLAAFSPYYWTWLLGEGDSMAQVVVGPALWFPAVLVVWVSGSKHRWLRWLTLLTGPVCVWPLAEGLWAFFCWHVSGFAP